MTKFNLTSVVGDGCGWVMIGSDDVSPHYLEFIGSDIKG